MDYQAFLDREKALLISPAGYGKTFCLSECVKHAKGKSLILTHTHAGVASIKAKLREQNISSSKYSVETISSFAQKYVWAYYIGSDIPAQETNVKQYHTFLIQEGKRIFASRFVQSVLKASYSGVFVDEYQDCSKNQHEMILALCANIPLRVFADPLQAIFDFNEETVDFSSDFTEFEQFPTLSIPHRWNLVGQFNLGKALDAIRESLINGQDIDLTDYSSEIELLIVNKGDLYKPGSECREKLNQIRKESSLLIIHPDSASKHPRITFSKTFKDISMIESIDDPDFYKLASAIDQIGEEILEKNIRDLSYLLFTKTGLDSWFNANGFKNKQAHDDKEAIEVIKKTITDYRRKIDFKTIFEGIRELKGVSCIRPELARSLYKALEISDNRSCSVLSAMKEQRNNVRRNGRSISGKHIGTTLLTKGLEFETVVILEAHKYQSSKHLYVALTRCRKRLIVFSESKILSPFT